MRVNARDAFLEEETFQVGIKMESFPDAEGPGPSRSGSNLESGISL